MLNHVDSYDSEDYKQHMERYESLSNQFEQLEGYQYERISVSICLICSNGFDISSITVREESSVIC
jgi:ribosomal protein L30E